ncbi:MAG: hypothetical protein ABW194_05125 [Novosphingobium sp.]
MAGTLFLAACATNGTSPISQCNLHQVQPGRHGSLLLVIDGADDSAMPSAWQGPMHVSVNGEKTCVLSDESGIISGPFLFDGQDALFFTSYSGSNQQAKMLAISQCKIKWKSEAFGAGTLAAERGRLQVGAKRWRLADDCVPSPVRDQ